MSISGFVEWLPQVREIEKTWVERLSSIYKSNGFCSIETASVELLKDLERKGEIDKEIYFLTKRIENETPMGLHFDLTVPTARYVVENYSSLSFPFKRQQIQKVWRGERPQFGRYREFYQADIDIIDSEKLSLFYDAEVLVLGVTGMLALKIPSFTVGISNRKIFEGYLLGIGCENPVPVLRIIDKLDKIGVQGVIDTLTKDLGFASDFAALCVSLCELKLSTRGDEIRSAAGALPVSHPLLEEGLQDLAVVMEYVELMAGPEVLSRIQPNLSFVRGFDYYTGTIFEGQFVDGEGYGSICSGGRYENLTQGFSSKKLPGVGFSIGLTRILAFLERKGISELEDYFSHTCDFYAIFTNAESSSSVLSAARRLSESGYSVMVLHTSLKKGIKSADKANIPAVLFDFDGDIFVKFLVSGEQISLPEFERRAIKKTVSL